MQQLIEALRSLPEDVATLDSEPPALRGLSDAELVRAVASAIARPKRARSDSFTIHAPLELLARAALLTRVPPARRLAVRLRIAAIATEYAKGEEIAAPAIDFASVAAAVDRLKSALREGDADLADAAVTFLAGRLSAWDARTALADEVAPCLGLAAHAPILLAGLPEATARWGDLNGLLRAPIRALAVDGDARLGWIDAPRAVADGGADLFEALAAPAHVASPHLFIIPTMLAVEADGFAARTLTRATETVSIEDCRRDLMRIAALSMLQDDPAHAPYGWTHCLTMPQGVLALGEHARHPRRHIRVAATHALGFRSTLGSRRLTPEWQARSPPPDVTALVARAAAHPDAHLAKYTLACLTAAAQDVAARGLYLAAADYLGDWWDAHPGGEFGG
jgi:hypothetical protein